MAKNYARYATCPTCGKGPRQVANRHGECHLCAFKRKRVCAICRLPLGPRSPRNCRTCTSIMTRSSDGSNARPDQFSPRYQARLKQYAERAAVNAPLFTD